MVVHGCTGPKKATLLNGCARDIVGACVFGVSVGLHLSIDLRAQVCFPGQNGGDKAMHRAHDVCLVWHVSVDVLA